MLYKGMSDSIDMTTHVNLPIAIPIASNPQFIKVPALEEPAIKEPALEEPAI